MLVIILLSCALISCASENDEDKPTENPTQGSTPTSNEQQQNNQNQPESSTGNPSDQNSPQLAEVYKKYPNLVEIGKFYNNIAPFVISKTEGKFYGYMDITGKVIVEPQYNHHATMGKFVVYTTSIPQFNDSNYVTVHSYTTNSNLEKSHLIDKSGKIILSTNDSEIVSIGDVQNGYFYVETRIEAFPENLNTITYYSATDMRVVATFENKYPYVLGPDYDRNDRSNISKDGTAQLLSRPPQYNGGIVDFNIADYDSSFTVKQDVWNVDLYNIDELGNVTKYYHVSEQKNSVGYIASVILQKEDDDYYFATVDDKGNVLMKPQNTISFGLDANKYYHPITLNNLMKESFDYCKDLCPAMDVESGLWGYIDPYGNWKIQPQFSSAESFSKDGYATVESKIIIDTNGRIILSAPRLSIDDVYGTYISGDYTLTLTKDGNITVEEHPYSCKGKYKLTGNLVLYDMATSSVKPFNPSSFIQNGTYLIKKEGDNLIINSRTWTKVPTN